MGVDRTLGQAVKDGANGLRLYCTPCSYSCWFSPAHALVLWGPEATFAEITQRAKCRHCGLQATSAAPDWPLHPTGGASLAPCHWRGYFSNNPGRPLKGR